MKENELVRDMYSCLNLVINELNSIGINKLDDADIMRKIISLLITILHNLEDLSQMTPTLLIRKIVTFEMSHEMGQENPTSSKTYACTCVEHKKMKGNKKVESSSSSSVEEGYEEQEDYNKEEDDQPSTSFSKVE
jgi:hypothetical protein